jgi:hypothetical protein
LNGFVQLFFLGAFDQPNAVHFIAALPSRALGPPIHNQLLRNDLVGGFELFRLTVNVMPEPI